MNENKNLNKNLKRLAIDSLCRYGMPSYDEMGRGKYTHSQYNKMIEDSMNHFAESIVKECANLIKSKAGQVDDMRPIGVFQVKVMNEDANMILKHFGVK